MELTRLHDSENGGATVICEGHVDKSAFANRVDTDDVADILGDDFEGEDSYPTADEVLQIAEMVRHSWGAWSQEGTHRRWDECGKNEPGAQPFTVLDQEGNP